MHVLQGLEQLIDDELFVYFFENACANDDMQI